jgi:hypothetical protein
MMLATSVWQHPPPRPHPPLLPLLKLSLPQALLVSISGRQILLKKFLIKLFQNALPSQTNPRAFGKHRLKTIPTTKIFCAKTSITFAAITENTKYDTIPL